MGAEGQRTSRAMGPGATLGVWRTVSTAALVGVAAVLVTVLLSAVGSDWLGHDFRTAYLPAAEAVRELGNPYAQPEIPFEGWEPYVYPPQLAFALVPLTVLPADVAALVAVLGCLAALLGALAVIGVRDVRCYAALLVWAPGFYALEFANASAVMALAVALVWRWKEALGRSAVVLGLAVSTKLFLWPLFVWALATRRFRVAGLAAVIGLAVTTGAWAVIGFDGLVTYPDQLAVIPDEGSYSIRALVTTYGGSALVGDALAVVVGAALLGAVIVLGRRGDDLRAFSCAIAAGLALTPVVWQHYLVLLAVPLGLARPRFSAVWLLPIALWVSPPGNPEGLEPLLPAAVAVTLLAVILASPRSPLPRLALGEPVRSE